MRANAVALVAFMLCALFSRAHAQAPSATARPSGSAIGGTITLRAGDVVRIEVNGEPTLAGEFVIGPDGQVLLPTIGLVQVASRPFAEVERELRAAYGKQFTNVVARFTPLLRIAVLGEVRQPGLYLIDPTYTVIVLLARAGGLTPSANASRIDVVHADGEPTARLDAQISAVVFALRSGDQVLVQRRSWIRENLGIFVGAAGSIAVAVITGLMLR